MRVNFDQNYYDVMRQIIENAVDEKYECQTSINKDGKQYGVKTTFAINELHFENENMFVPMKEEKI